MNEGKAEPVKIKSLLWIVIVATLLSIILAYFIKLNYQLFLDVIFPTDPFLPIPYNIVGVFFILLGFGFIIWANFTLLYIGKIGLKNREPFHVPYKLVLEGPYQFTRNPIYLGAILLVIGFAVLIGSLTILISSVLLFLLFHYCFIRWEEKKLEETFGEEYRDYKNRVRRWL